MARLALLDNLDEEMTDDEFNYDVLEKLLLRVWAKLI